MKHLHNLLKIMSFRKNLWNRLWNTVWVAPRAAWAWIHTVLDATKTALYWALDPIEWIWKTAWNIKDAIHNAFTTWKRYHKLWKVPASLVATPFMLVEWAAETLRHTWCNLFKNARDTVANPFINVWHWIKRMWSAQDIWSFSFAKIDNRPEVNPKNRLANWGWRTK